MGVSLVYMIFVFINGTIHFALVKRLAYFKQIY